MGRCLSLVLSACLLVESDLVPAAAARPARITFVGAVVVATCVGNPSTHAFRRQERRATWHRCHRSDTDVTAFRSADPVLTQRQISRIPAIVWLRQHGEPDVAASIIIRTRTYR